MILKKFDSFISRLYTYAIILKTFQIIQLETEVDLLKTKEQELLKEVRRLEQRNKLLMDQVGEEQAKLISMTEAYDKTQEKMKRYKGQIEGAVRFFLFTVLK